MTRYQLILAGCALLCLPTGLHGQQWEVKAGSVVTRAYEENGFGWSIGLSLFTNDSLLGGRLGLGIDAWNAKSNVETGNPFDDKRSVFGFGAKPQWRVSVFGPVQLNVGVPMIVAKSSIPDRLTSQGITTPDTTQAKPLEDRVHEATGWAIGLEGAIVVHIAGAVIGSTSLAALHQRVLVEDTSPYILFQIALGLRF